MDGWSRGMSMQEILGSKPGQVSVVLRTAALEPEGSWFAANDVLKESLTWTELFSEFIRMDQ